MSKLQILSVADLVMGHKLMSYILSMYLAVFINCTFVCVFLYYWLSSLRELKADYQQMQKIKIKWPSAAFFLPYSWCFCLRVRFWELDWVKIQM